MDLSFAVQAMSAMYIMENRGKLENTVVDVSGEIDDIIARRKLAAWGIEIDTLTPEAGKVPAQLADLSSAGRLLPARQAAGYGGAALSAGRLQRITATQQARATTMLRATEKIETYSSG